MGNSFKFYWALNGGKWELEVHTPLGRRNDLTLTTIPYDAEFIGWLDKVVEVLAKDISTDAYEDGYAAGYAAGYCDAEGEYGGDD